MSISDIRSMDVKKIEWFYNRLAEQKRDEQEQMDKNINGV